jgi:hypothetical protein
MQYIILAHQLPVEQYTRPHCALLGGNVLPHRVRVNVVDFERQNGAQILILVLDEGLYPAFTFYISIANRYQAQVQQERKRSNYLGPTFLKAIYVFGG